MSLGERSRQVLLLILNDFDTFMLLYDPGTDEVFTTSSILDVGANLGNSRIRDFPFLRCLGWFVAHGGLLVSHGFFSV